MDVIIKCDACDWKKPGGWVPVWYFRKCPKCGAMVINTADLGLWVALKLLMTYDGLVRLFKKDVRETHLHIKSRPFSVEVQK